MSELSNVRTDPDLGRESLNGDSPPPQSTRPTHPGFAGLDATAAYVLGTDGNLWLENGPWGTVPPARQHVDGNVAAVQALSATAAYVLGTDGNLWLENGPWGTVPPARQHVDGNVSIRERASITYNHSVDLGADAGHIAGPVNLTITSDGSYNFSGQLNNSGASSYTVNVIVAAVSKKGMVFTFAGSQSIGSGVVPFGLLGGSNNWDWNNTGNNAQIKENWADLAGGFVRYQGTADSDMGAIWNTLVSDIQSALQDIEGALPTIEEVIQIVGQFAILLA
jgi:hypothetical protein